MTKQLVTLLFLFSYLFLPAREYKSVVFGNHLSVLEAEKKNQVRIFVDMNGDYYPSVEISNDELRNEGNSKLKIWAGKFPEKFKKIAEAYKLEKTDYSIESFNVLQDSIISALTSRINTKSKNFKETVFLVHGYRKRLVNDNGKDNSGSAKDNKDVKESIASVSPNNFYVEVYWDGKYEPFYGYLQLVKMYKKGAIPNAINVGYSLRKLFPKIDREKLTLVSHSTGTFVLANLLFNTQKYQRRGNVNSPAQNLNVVLLASASPGKSMFKDYYDRNSTVDYKQQDNYNLINAYNPKDIVLLKRGFSKFMGNTSLGCNFKGESDKLKKYFAKEFKNSPYSQVKLDDIGGNHYMTAYGGAANFKVLIKALLTN